MKRLFTAALLLAASFASNAQNQISELGCATVTTESEIQEVYEYVKHAPAAKTTAGVDTIPLTIQIVGTDIGTNYYRLDHLFSVICELNTRFAPVGFYYYIKWPIRYIKNTSYFIHDFSTGYQMMNDENVAGTVNVYFVSDPAGACGYYSPGGGAVAIKNSCSNPGSTTLTHELGHFFGLPHTFYGWENNNTPSNPEKVTRGAGANCSTAGDGFCDTDADYISDRWSCPYSGTKYDQNGQLYHPDSSIYMSYSSDACQSRFSGQEMGRMQSRLLSNYAYLLNGTPAHYSDMSFPNILYPTDSVHSNFTKVIWNKVADAEYYHVKISQVTPAIIRVDTLVKDTMINISYKMANNNDYTVQIAPLNSVNVCRAKNVTKKYIYTNNTTPLTLADFAINGSTVRVTPNPTYGSELNVYMDAVKTGVYTIRVVNISGQKMIEQKVNNVYGNYNATVSLDNIPGGLYFVQVEGMGQKWMHKVSVIR